MMNLATWKLNWLEAVADAGAAKQLTPLAVLIAIKCATWYMNKSETWGMGAKSLAKMLGRDRRNVRIFAIATTLTRGIANGTPRPHRSKKCDAAEGARALPCASPR